MDVPSVVQGKCTGCDENYEMSDVRSHTVDSDNATVKRVVECLACDETATIKVSENGIETSGAITYEDASWNQDDEEEEE